MTLLLQKILLHKLSGSVLSIIFIILVSTCTVFTQCGNGHPLIKGPKGGCYYISDTGKKQYVDRSCCQSLGIITDNKQISNRNSKGCGFYKNKPLIKGSKGGCYYINRNGNKTYVEKHLCNC
ncbi:MAG TPA: hypothetical protein PKD16_16315 [Saprospiraceae bacterium]|jgi:uncharacterized protein YjhX (UPF0386 family)|nr:hypothetical protein [Saprospiraceae bacterium]HMT71735.1 hypothetical protein [Saprospiraceae bacterium]